MIDEFRGKNEFLSNFYKREISLDFLPAFPGELITAPTNEHAFQACKSDDANAAKLIVEAADASTAKKLGRQAKLIDGWDDARVGFMKKVCEAKFNQHVDLKMRLLMTGDRPLVEGNTWKDEFWGISSKTGKGENHLGKILMEVRSEIVKNEGSILDVLQTKLEKDGLGFVGKNISDLYHVTQKLTSGLPDGSVTIDDVIEALEKAVTNLGGS